MTREPPKSPAEGEKTQAPESPTVREGSASGTAWPRRRFLGRVGAGVAAVGWARSASAYAANEQVRLGAIGVGGRMRGALIPAARKVGGVRFVALCDVWDRSLAAARETIGDDARSLELATRDHRAVLDRKDVDAVLVATPDHWHVPITVDACDAGKDVYVEKPLTHHLSEGEAVIAAQNRNRRVVQVGMQQRSMPQFLEGAEMVRSGLLGKVHKIHLTWNRNAGVGGRHRYGIAETERDWKRFLGKAPERDFDEYRFRNWRWFWDYGGGILTDLMVHYHDVANWFCDLHEPASASAIGDHFRTRGVWETPDTIQTLIHYPDREVQLYFEGTFVNARNRAMLEFMGTEATLYLDRARYEVIPESDRVEARSKDYGGGVRGADFSSVDGGFLHMQNWLDCVRSRETPRAPAEEGVRAVWGAHLGNRAYRYGRTERWSASGTTEGAGQ